MENQKNNTLKNAFKIAKKQLNTEKGFNGLVKNALEFMDESINQISSNPKYSLINFYTALELFLKAKLLKEHWTLIIQRPENASLSSFNGGNFQSVTLKDLLDRLKNICGVNLHKNTTDCFDDLRNHRNRLVHFYNNKYQLNSSKAIEMIVSEQCKAWYRLHKLITNDWQQDFNEFIIQIDTLNNNIHKHRCYLEAKFQECVPEINKLKRKGNIVSKCPSCEFEAAINENIIGPVFSQKCIICSNSLRFIQTICNNCNQEVKLFDPQMENCPNCKYKITISSLISEYSDSVSPKEALIESQTASCNECRGYETAAKVDDVWLCFSCLQTFKNYYQCEWCSQNIVGEYKETYLNGCEHCDGLIGWDDD